MVYAESHLYTLGASVRVDLGIPTLQDIPPAPARRPATPVTLSPDQAHRRSR
ncbi:hypothetical protein OG920_40040 [Streptomyces europaeiscabiei]|uniref:hypothetical protein n=1 Tax=Streptomyces TaxID=1883 RepID=UPI0015C50324|nr:MULTISPECIES: hypothetical protein [Streptomyces]MDX3584747.1 hypothetical protein [Streptomyces europaeiscabiei]WUD37128.1 hypothetical protein OG858_40755 [Streptomyces europaeiscabiei]